MTRSIFLAISTVIAMTSLTLLRPAHASPSFKRQNPNQVYSSCTIPGTAAITFEGGPYIYTTTAVNTLNNAGAKGTFFLARYNYECIYSEPGMDAVRSEYDGGHQVGLYTWSNADLTTLSGDEIQAELANIRDAVKNITGATAASLRPKNQDYNDNVKEIAKGLGLIIYISDVDIKDSEGATPAQSKATIDEAIKNKPGSMLIRMQDVYQATVEEVLPYAIQALQTAGYRLVTVAECTGVQAYQQVLPPITPDANWNCNN